MSNASSVDQISAMTFDRSAQQTGRSTKRATGWGLKDIAVALTLGAATFSIVEIPGIPISPLVFAPFLLFLICYTDWLRARASILGSKLFLTFLALNAIQILATLIRFGISYEAIAKSGRIMAAVVLCVSLLSYVLNAAESRFSRVFSLFVVLLFVSVLWFLGEITLVEPFVGIRLMLYADIYAAFFSGSEGDFTRSGLTPFLHILGYQLSFLLSVVLVRLTLGGSKFERTARFLILVLGFTALYYSAQRSAFFAVALSLIVFSYYRGSLRQVVWVFAILMLLAGALLTVTSLAAFETDYLQVSVIEKLISREYWTEAVFRLQLQGRALELIFLHPFGLPDLGDWVTEGFWPVYAESNIGPMSNPIAVHNSYLGVALECGMPFLLLCLLFLVQLTRAAHRTLRWSVSRRGDAIASVQAVAAGLPGLFLLQSTTHNSSLFTQDMSCIVAFCLVATADILRREEARVR